ncbi:MAG: hypothetical protein HY079_01685, partial [Elusimicrobia bacterium]|nr:hypothetical protein [Elusimicrobiota bacterium]
PAPAGAVSAVYQASVTVAWPAQTAQGFEVRASSTDFGALTPGGAVHVSTSGDGAATGLTTIGMLANTTYYLRAASLNWSGAANEAIADSASTLALRLTGGISLQVFSTSATATWTARPVSPSTQTCEGYRLDAATAPASAASDFTGTLFSSVTYARASTALTLTGLDAGTTYSFRVGPLNWAAAPNYLVVGTSRTTVTPMTWTGAGGDGRWYTTTNWSPNGTPNAGAPVTIGIAASVTVAAADPAISFSSLTIGSPAGVAVNLAVATGIARGGSVLIYGKAGFTQATTTHLLFDGDWTMLSGSSLTQTGVTANPQNAEIDLSVTGLFDLQAGATITVSSAGFRGGASGAANGMGPGGGSGNTAGGGGGGGHGGVGGTASGGGGPTNDSTTDPVLAGSGGAGGAGATTNAGGAGGGAVRIVAGEFRLNGVIDALGSPGGNGTGVTTRAAGGGGAGGSVNISAAVFSGAGIVRALGGSGGTDTNLGTQPGGGGGGGRVALDVTQSGNLCTVVVSTAGGPSGGGTSTAGAGGTYSSTTTLAAPVLTASNPTTSSLDWAWTASYGATQYQLFSTTGASGASPMSPPLGAATLNYTLSGLTPNTTYSLYARASACGALTDSSAAAAPTAAAVPVAAAPPLLPGNDEFSLGAAWTGNGNPVDVTSYTVVASPSTPYPNADQGNVSLTTAPAGASLSALLTGLYPNTTYFLFVAAVNHAGAATSYAALGSTSTLARAPTLLPSSYLTVGFSSAAVRWGARPLSPPDASSKTCEGYLLEASSTNFGAASPGGVTLSSLAYSAAASTLTITGLSYGTTWYFRVASLNWAGAPNYVSLEPLNLDLSPSIFNLSFGTLDAAASRYTIATSSLEIVNTGSLPVTLAMWASTTTAANEPWTLATSSGIETAVLQAVWNASPPTLSDFKTPLLPSTTTAGGFGGPFAGDQSGVSIPVGGKRTLWFLLWLPTSTVPGPQTIQVGTGAVYP